MPAAATLRYLAQTFRTSRLSRARPGAVRRVQAERFRRLLRFAVERSPLYRERFKGIDLRRCRLEDLPPLTKAEGMAGFDRWVTDPAVTRRGVEAFIADHRNLGTRFLGRYIALHTSGSQGQSAILMQAPADFETLFQLYTTRGNAAGESGLGEMARRLRDPARLAIVTLKQGFYPTGATFDFFPPQLARFVKTLRLSHTQPDVLDRLNEYSPTNLTAYASVLLDLAAAKETGRLRLPHLRQLVNVSELLTDTARERLLRVFGVPVMNTYAFAECLFASNGCPTDPGVHVNEDWAILENRDAAGRPVPPGTQGAMVYLTNLSNRIQPVIRYVIHDAVTWATGPCRCGSTLPRIAQIGGRGNDTLWAPAAGGGLERLDPFIFRAAFNYCTDVLDWKLEQDRPDRVRLTVVPVPGEPFDDGRLRARVAEQLREHGFASRVAIDYARAARFEPDPATGKVKKVVCRVRPSELGGALSQGSG